MSFNTFPSNQLYGSHRYGNTFSGVSSVPEGGGSTGGSSNGGGRYRKRKYQEPSPEDNISFELGKNKRVTVRQFRNINLVDIREYYQDSATGEMKPGKKGISLTEEQYDELLHNQFKIDDALRQFGSKRKKAKMMGVDQSDGEAPAVREIQLNKRKQADREEARREKKERSRENGKKKQIVHPPQIIKKATDPMNPRLDDIPNPRLEVPRNPRLDDLAKPSNVRAKEEVKHHEDDDLNSSDEDFANALESEVRRQDEDISEEE